MKLKEYLLSIKNQLLIILLFLGFKLLVNFHVLPDEKYIVSLLSSFFDKYGYYAVGIASFLENLIGFGSYFPGSIVILTSMSLTAGDLSKAFITFLFIFIPSTISHVINFLIGKRISRYHKYTKRSMNFFLFTTLWHPHFASVSAFTLGGQKIGFNKFIKYFLPVHFFWNLFWGLLIYNIGRLGHEDMSFFNLFYLYMGLWIMWDTYLYFKRIHNLKKTGEMSSD